MRRIHILTGLSGYIQSLCSHTSRLSPNWSKGDFTGNHVLFNNNKGDP